MIIPTIQSAWPYLAGGVLCAMLLLLAWIDWKVGQLPDVLTLSLLWAGLLVNVGGVFTPLPEAVLGAAVGYSFLWCANGLYRWRMGCDGMGYGDFKLTAALGAWFGIAFLPWIVVGACAAGLGAALGMPGVGRGTFKQERPFGPYLAAAGIVSVILVFSR